MASKKKTTKKKKAPKKEPTPITTQNRAELRNAYCRRKA